MLKEMISLLLVHFLRVTGMNIWSGNLFSPGISEALSTWESIWIVTDAKRRLTWVQQIWSIAIRDGIFVLEHVKRMHHMDQAGFNIGATITAILPMTQVVYTGDDDGRVVSCSKICKYMACLTWLSSTSGTVFKDNEHELFDAPCWQEIELEDPETRNYSIAAARCLEH